MRQTKKINAELFWRCFDNFRLFEKTPNELLYVSNQKTRLCDIMWDSFYDGLQNMCWGLYDICECIFKFLGTDVTNVEVQDILECFGFELVDENEADQVEQMEQVEEEYVSLDDLLDAVEGGE